MKDFFQKLGRTAAGTLRKTGDKAGEVMEIGKLKARIRSIENDAEKARKRIGDYCMDLYDEDLLENEELRGMCFDVKECCRQIEDIEIEIESVKDEYRKKYDE